MCGSQGAAEKGCAECKAVEAGVQSGGRLRRRGWTLQCKETRDFSQKTGWNSINKSEVCHSPQGGRPAPPKLVCQVQNGLILRAERRQTMGDGV